MEVEPRDHDSTIKMLFLNELGACKQHTPLNQIWWIAILDAFRVNCFR